MMILLIRRNLRLFFRDKASVFFSMLGVIIIIGLYMLFLKSMVADGGLAAGEHAQFMMDSWIMGGVIATTTVSTTMGAFGIMVEDTAKKVIKDFEVSPVRRWQLVLAYVVSAIVIGIVMSLFTFVAAEGYILINGGEIISLGGLVRVLGIIVLSVTASSALIFFIAAFMRSQNAFGVLSTVLGTLIGFLTGVYVPIGVLPEAVQPVIRIFPISHAAVLFRQALIREAVDLDHLPVDVKQMLGIQFWYGDWQMPVWGNIAVLVATALLFYGLSIVVVSKRRRSA